MGAVFPGATPSGEAPGSLGAGYGGIVVVKYGGHAMVSEALKAAMAEDLTALWRAGVRLAVVHGGGPVIGRALQQAGIEGRFIDGLRVTDMAVLEVVERALDQVNSDLVSLIRAAGARAVGLKGNHGLTCARRHPIPGLGYVGEVEAIDREVFEARTVGGHIGVVSPMGRGRDGHTYNINADTVGGALAMALKADRLVMLTDVPGVAGDRERLRILPALDAGGIRDLTARGIICGGMLPKAEAALRALEGGVPRVDIVDGRREHALLRALAEEGYGTAINRDK
ncbi:MAG: acetylglutamate kinase [Bacillota bacterium]